MDVQYNSRLKASPGRRLTAPLIRATALFSSCGVDSPAWRAKPESPFCLPRAFRYSGETGETIRAPASGGCCRRDTRLMRNCSLQSGRLRLVLRMLSAMLGAMLFAVLTGLPAPAQPSAKRENKGGVQANKSDD